MADTTYEEATRCPKCKHPGETKIKRKLRAQGIAPGTEVHMVYCTNEVCPWYGTAWAVQVNPDGTVPPPTTKKSGPKVYQGFEDHDRLAQQIKEALEAQQAIETSGHGEIRNPNSR